MAAAAISPVPIALAQLRPAVWNANVTPPRTMAKIRRSIERFGFVENLVARPHPDEPGAFEVISGNHRLRLAGEIGIDPVPVVVGDYDDVEARREAKPTTADLHPTMKPVRLLRHLIHNSTVAGDRVLDLFAGSGSTLLAAAQAGRRCFAMELDPGYCDVIRRRYESFAGGRTSE